MIRALRLTVDADRVSPARSIAATVRLVLLFVLIHEPEKEL